MPQGMMFQMDTFTVGWRLIVFKVSGFMQGFRLNVSSRTLLRELL